MAELEISINQSTPEPEKDFRDLIEDLESETGMQVHCNVFRWEDAWSEIMKIVLYKHGPMISQVGTTWMGSLEATDGARTITPAEMSQIAHPDSLHRASMASCVADDKRITGLPWFIDAYMLYYRVDLLEKNHIDPATAFTSIEALTETVAKLHTAGYKIPLALGQIQSLANIHNIAIWIWTHGGDFISEDGKRLLWTEEKTRLGMRAYFELARHITPPQPNPLTDPETYNAFGSGNAVITLRNAGMLHLIQESPTYNQMRDRIELSPMPGVNFVGGSNLVLWKHLPPQLERNTIRLLNHLLSPDVQYRMNVKGGFLPASLDALEKVKQETRYKPVISAIARGRSFRKFRLWGLLEEKFSLAVGRIWQKLHEQSNLDIDQVIASEIDPLERRLQLTISNS